MVVLQPRRQQHLLLVVVVDRALRVAAHGQEQRVGSSRQVVAATDGRLLFLYSRHWSGSTWIAPGSNFELAAI
jgi:hypothetical protein